MKSLIIIILTVILIPVCTLAQGYKDEDRPGYQKIKELERIRLIEALGMNEETTLRFFARRTEHRDEIKKLKGDRDRIIEEINTTLKSDSKSRDEAALKNLFSRYIKLEQQIDEEKLRFITSLDDILRTDQILRLISFERSFNEEMRRLLMKERKRRGK